MLIRVVYLCQYSCWRSMHIANFLAAPVHLDTVLLSTTFIMWFLYHSEHKVNAKDIPVCQFFFQSSEQIFVCGI